MFLEILGHMLREEARIVLMIGKEIIYMVRPNEQGHRKTSRKSEGGKPIESMKMQLIRPGITG